LVCFKALDCIFRLAAVPGTAIRASIAWAIELTRANDRNEVAARLADRIITGHATASGALAQQSARWQEDGWILRHISDADVPHG
jgi:hypothetical protein